MHQLMTTTFLDGLIHRQVVPDRCLGLDIVYLGENKLTCHSSIFNNWFLLIITISSEAFKHSDNILGRYFGANIVDMAEHESSILCE